MTDASRNFTHADGSFDVFDAIENGQSLHKQAINKSFPGLLTRLFDRNRRSNDKLAVSTVDKRG